MRCATEGLRIGMALTLGNSLKERFTYKTHHFGTHENLDCLCKCFDRSHFHPIDAFEPLKLSEVRVWFMKLFMRTTKACEKLKQAWIGSDSLFSNLQQGKLPFRTTCSLDCTASNEDL